MNSAVGSAHRDLSGMAFGRHAFVGFWQAQRRLLFGVFLFVLMRGVVHKIVFS